MHISDGVLPPAVTVSTAVVSAGMVVLSVRRLHYEDYPRIAVMTAAFFVASLIHIPLGPTSVHLLLPGLVGIVLGPLSFLAIALGLVLQCFLFQFGGVTALGANALMMGIPAVLSGYIFRAFAGRHIGKTAVVAGIAGAIGVLTAALILAVLLALSGEVFWGVAKVAFLAHIPVAAVEGGVSAFAVSFLYRVKPELLKGTL
ncbi:cobalt transporter CbiM [Thermodesulforhabdus norvegica]|uniref:Cobalt/nickel transport system permease protein n=1 Tax=Thermodesulforhabdus norvegica TaxID=39841 RepID=A0A1I4R7B0_9BACT|nr:cobalt transporter CbiM [Thermodesulforhabdus norvegica]SFM48192.1 cobalt/nickel transport system permease protein [Thermodesulforhabdus norvegica]